MSVKEVTYLRKEGRLDEALELARRELNEERNSWTCMSLFWVLRDFAISQYIPAGDLGQVRNCLEEMQNLLYGMRDEDGVAAKAYQSVRQRAIPNINEVKRLADMSKTNPNEAYKTITEKFGKGAESLDYKLHEDFGWVVYRYIKANSGQLTSAQIRGLLRDYIQLKNERPSLLHSVVLNYALSFSKDHSDFKFSKFLMLWGVKNLRYEDYQKGQADGREIPSLISRICKAIIDSKENFDVLDFVSQFERKNIVIEELRQTYFWRLMNLHKENRTDELMQDFANYAENFSALGPSHWHSEILKIANRFMTENYASHFMPFVLKWDGKGNLRREDWQKEKSDTGKEFPSLAEKSAKKCFEVVKANIKTNKVPTTTLTWLKALYEKVKNLDSEDDWDVRNYATICAWCGETKEAVSLYKSLLLHMGEKYYLWAELANLISDDNDLSIGLLLKAKKAEKNEDFLGDIHLSLASSWLKAGYSAVAKEELDVYASHRQEKGWALTDKYRGLLANLDANSGTPSEPDFNSYICKAEDFVYGDYDWVDFAVTRKWTSDGIERCSLSNGDDLTLSVKTKKFPILKKAKEGAIIQFRCKIVEEKPVNLPLAFRSAVIVKKTVTPLIARKTDKEKWSILPLKYGVIDYVNESKKIHHIITQDSKQTFSEYKGEALPVDSFVKFREYVDKRKDETRICIAHVEACSSDEALQFMPSRIAVVDDVNTKKQLFHIVLGRGEVSDVVRFDQTDLRPNIGDSLRISFCLKKNKEGKERIKFLDIQTSDQDCEDVKLTVTGLLELKYRNNDYYNDEDFDEDYNLKPDYAFIEDYYVHKSILKKYNITRECKVTAKVILSGDNKWKVYDLEVLKED